MPRFNGNISPPPSSPSSGRVVSTKHNWHLIVLLLLLLLFSWAVWLAAVVSAIVVKELRHSAHRLCPQWSTSGRDSSEQHSILSKHIGHSGRRSAKAGSDMRLAV